MSRIEEIKASQRERASRNKEALGFYNTAEMLDIDYLLSRIEVLERLGTAVVAIYGRLDGGVMEEFADVLALSAAEEKE
jgi:hypothetical protein